jgi:hypothetical protein
VVPCGCSFSEDSRVLRRNDAEVYDSNATAAAFLASFTAFAV